MIPWITLVVMADWGALYVAPFSLSLFTCLIHLVGVMYPWVSIQPSLSIPTHHRKIQFGSRQILFLSKLKRLDRQQQEVEHSHGIEAIEMFGYWLLVWQPSSLTWPIQSRRNAK